MFIEFQIKSGKFAALLLNRVRSVPICAPTSVFSVGGSDFIIDHCWWSDAACKLKDGADTPVSVNLAGGATQAILIANLQLVLTLEIFLKTPALAEDPSVPTDQYAQTLSIDVVLDLLAQGGSFCATFSRVDFRLVALDDATRKQVEAAFMGFGSVCGGLDLTPLNRLLNDPLKPTNAGITADAALDRVALRLELDAPDAGVVSRWQAFHGGAIAADSLGRDWSLFLPQELMCKMMADRVQQALADAETDFLKDPAAAAAAGLHRLHLAKPPSAQWFPFFGGTVVVSFTGTLIDVVPITNDDIDVDVTLSSAFTLQGSGIHVDSTLDWDLNDADVIVALTSFGPAGFFAMPVSRAIADAFFDKKFIPATPPCKTLDKTHLSCDFAFELSPIGLGTGIAFGTLAVTDMTALLPGPMLAGSLTVMELKPPLVNIEVDGWNFGVAGSCGSYSAGDAARVLLSGSAPPIGPVVRLCAPVDVSRPPVTPGDTIPPDALAAIQVGSPSSVWLPTEVALDVTTLQLPASYYQHPYRIRLVFRTSAGVRAVLVDAVEKPPQPDFDQVQKELQQRIAACELLQTGLFGIAGLFDLQWIPDPGPEQFGLHQWQIGVTGLEAGAVVALADSHGRALAHAPASAQGKLSLTTLTPPSAGKEVTLEHRAAAGSRRAAAGRGARRVVVQQRRLFERATLALEGTCVQLDAGLVNGVPMLVATDTGGVSVVDLTVPGMPVVRQRLADPGVRGAMLWGARVVTWGCHGWSAGPANAIDGSGGHVHGAPGWQGNDLPVLDLACSAASLLVLTAAGVTIYDAALARRACIECGAARFVAVCGEAIVVSHETGLRILDSSTRVAHDFELHGAAALRPVPANVAGHGHLYVQQCNGGGWVVDLTQPTRPRIAARYLRTPWFAQAATVGRWVAIRRDHARGVKLYEARRSVSSVY